MTINRPTIRVFVVGGIVIAVLGVASGLRERQSRQFERERIAQLSPAEKAVEDRAAAAALQLKANTYFLDACREKVAQQLHDPGSAQWLDLTPFAVELRGSSYRGQVQLRAKNSLGALRLASFECTGALGRDGFAILSVKSVE